LAENCTAYYPQADGQTEVLNQSLEISLRAYVGPSRDDWASYLNALALSYNSTPHTATGYALEYLLRGYTPITSSTILHSLNSIGRPFENPSQMKLRCSAILENINESLQPEAMEMVVMWLEPGEC
jgi:hypothetical protein